MYGLRSPLPPGASGPFSEPTLCTTSTVFYHSRRLIYQQIQNVLRIQNWKPPVWQKALKLIHGFIILANHVEHRSPVHHSDGKNQGWNQCSQLRTVLENNGKVMNKVTVIEDVCYYIRQQ